MSITADFAQTFYVDKEAVKGSGYAFINGVHLFFKSKPPLAGASTDPASGLLIPKPGVTVYICETEVVNGIAVPKLTSYAKYGRVRVEYDNILTSSTGLTATEFNFDVPVPVATDKSYAVVIKCDGNDSQYGLWRNKAGETYNGIQNPTVTKGALDGHFFTITNGTVPTPLMDTDLKFVLKGQKFSTTPQTYSAVNRNYEFLSINKSNVSGSLVGGEMVFANTGYVAGETVSVSATSNTITGTGTSFGTDFAVGDHIVVNSDTDNNIRKITAIANSTSMTVDRPFEFTNTTSNYLIAPVATVIDFNYLRNFCVLTGSTANATHNFISNSSSHTIVGEFSGAAVGITEVINFPVSYFTPEFKILTPQGTTSNLALNIANSSIYSDTEYTGIKLFEKQPLTSYKGYCFSRSTEVTDGSASLDNDKSVNFELQFSTENEFVTPVLDEEDLQFHATSIYINSQLAGEHTSRGQATSKLITKKINLANNQSSEDVRAYVTAYRPAGTNVEVYVKLFSSEDYVSFDSTGWTRLKNVSPETLVSATSNMTDFVELEYELASYPLSSYSNESSGTRLESLFTINRNMNTLTTDRDDEISSVSVGSIIRIYNPLYPDNSVITTVMGINEYTVETSQFFDETDSILATFIGSGNVIEIVECPTAAFKDYVNSGIVKYFNIGGTEYSGYSSFAVKIVLTGDETQPYYPVVDNVRVLALSV